LELCNLSIISFRAGSIYVGNDEFIALDVKIYCARQSRNPITRENVASNIYIEDNTYIGAISIIRYGFKIGVGATIAAGSVIVIDILLAKSMTETPQKTK